MNTYFVPRIRVNILHWKKDDTPLVAQERLSQYEEVVLYSELMPSKTQSPQAIAIHNFFEKPESKAAKLTQFLIFVLIILSLVNLVIEFRYTEIFDAHRGFFDYSEYVILGAFTIEYVLRIATAPNKLLWARRPMNIVDFVAVFPAYLELVLHAFANTSSVRVLRLIRVLRFSRALRAFKLFKFGSLFKKILRYEDTILQTITPVIAMFIVGKSVIWILEANGLWIQDPSLGELFAIIGFALGIVLSQKISVTYDKFLQIEERVIQLYGTLRSLTLILNKVEKGLGEKVCKQWARDFLNLLKDPHADNALIQPANDKLYDVMSTVEPVPGEIAMLHGDICRDSAFCLSKKVRLTPRAYDTLLHQATMLYFAMIVVFIPGFTGMISVILASYTLYGMYNLTEDLDSIIGGEFNLIDIDLSEMERFVEE